MDAVVPGSASLFDCVDKKVLVILRDGRKLIGTLGTYDQFANLVLLETIERIIVGQKYGENEIGLFVIRGENVVLLGELDKENDDRVFEKLEKVSYKEVKTLLKEEIQLKKDNEQKKLQILHDRGFCTEVIEKDYY